MKKLDKVVIIREDECIGCTKCIPVCPTDAIIGSPDKMHTVIESACIGCELCIPPCPMDCIEVKPLPPRDTETRHQLAKTWQQRARNRKARIKAKSEAAVQQHQQAKSADSIQAMLDRIKRNRDQT